MGPVRFRRSLRRGWSWLVARLGFGRRMLPTAARGAALAGAPLVVTVVEQDGFTVTLPGAWRQRRTADGWELTEAEGSHRLTIRARQLLLPVADGALAGLVDRLFEEHRRWAMSVGADLVWADAPPVATAHRAQRRGVGECPRDTLRVALLTRSDGRQMLSASLVCRNLESRGTSSSAAFGALAAAVFDQLDLRGDRKSNGRRSH